jgi:ribosomal protein S18 acetylase RimI-like enzyme
VDVVSLGFQTDLIVRRLAGSIIDPRDRYVVVRTPANPGFRWGNFLLFPAPPRHGDAAGWRSAFAAEFPGAGHLALGIDGTRGDCGDAAELAGLGVIAHVSTVLTATHLREPAELVIPAVCRPLTGDDDWAQAVELRLARYGRSGDPAHHRFVNRHLREARELCGRGHGAWFGAFVEDRMRSGCGVITDGSGVLRFQSVETHPSYRRHGLARQVVYTAGRYGLTDLGAKALVIVADPDDVAIRIYRSLGFADAESQVQLEREP